MLALGVFGSLLPRSLCLRSALLSKLVELTFESNQKVSQWNLMQESIWILY